MNKLIQFFLATYLCITANIAAEKNLIKEQTGLFNQEEYLIPSNIIDIANDIKTYADENFSKEKIRDLYSAEYFEQQKSLLLNNFPLNKIDILNSISYEQFLNDVDILVNSMVKHVYKYSNDMFQFESLKNDQEALESYVEKHNFYNKNTKQIYTLFKEQAAMTELIKSTINTLAKNEVIIGYEMRIQNGGSYLEYDIVQDIMSKILAKKNKQAVKIVLIKQ